MQRGRAVIVCPEGTRGYDYHLRPFKKGPFVLAIAAQAPIVPTVVHGTREVMKKGSFWVRSGTVDLHFLEPVPTAGCDDNCLVADGGRASRPVRRYDERDVDRGCRRTEGMNDQFRLYF